MEPDQITTFADGLTEGLFAGAGSGFTKFGLGEVNIGGPASFTGSLVIGGGTQDGGTLRLSGTATLANNVAAITVQNGQLILDNSVTNNNDRLTDQASITINQGKLTIIGNVAGTTETIGAVTISANTRGVIESQTTGAGTNRLSLWALSIAATTQLELVGTNDALTETGDNQILLLVAGPTLTNNIIPNVIVTDSSGNVDLATIIGGTNGLALVPLPAEGYVNSFDLANPASNVKLTSSASIDSKTVNALIVGPGVILSGNSANTTLTVASPLAFDGSGTISVPYVAFSAATNIFNEAGGTGTISGIVTRTAAATAIAKFGDGTLALSGANQFDGR